MLRQIASVGGLTMLSRVLGFARDVLTAALLGAGPVADAFFVAFRLPNHFRALFAEGAFNAAFVPLFSGILVQDGREAARLFAERLMALMVVIQLVLLTVMLAIMPWFMRVFAPGFVDEPEKFQLAVVLTSITFPYLLFITLMSQLGAMMNALGRFAAAAAAPILLNLCLILGLVGLRPFVPDAGHALAWGVLAAGVVQFLYLAWDAGRAGMAPRLRMPRVTPEVRRFLAVLGPAALGAGVTQISLFFDTLIASWLPTGAVSYLYYADRLNQLPLGVIGVAVGTVLLPQLSRQLKSGDAAGAADSQNRAIEYTLVLTLPALAGFLAVSFPLIDGLFRRGAFTAADAEATAAVLRAYALGLPAFVLLKSLVSGFYARQDTATPVKVAVAAVAVNLLLKIALMGPLGPVGLALGTSVGAWVNCGLLAFVLHRRGHLVLDARLRRRLPRMLAAAAGTAVALVVADRLLAPFGARGDLQGLVSLSVLLATGALSYGGLAFGLGLVSRQEIAGLRRRR
ncbi:murein biosynthesis integral membrane protein MurJ [Arenibaculum pallidiluteum]|uniref:murein biosynthesis integral membrane protein MurJ n=1 Tax=Arenibaculum pallidiluteum TaxID=2812559 RepID=UPI001A97270B|nr:murein biosynthesis integral membrane protein MurJ [Arenibaculum pallidiluteum]